MIFADALLNSAEKACDSHQALTCVDELLMAERRSLMEPSKAQLGKVENKAGAQSEPVMPAVSLCVNVTMLPKVQHEKATLR